MDGVGRWLGKRRVNAPVFQDRPKLRISLLLLNISFMLTDGLIRTPCNKGVFVGGGRNLNYRLLEQLPLRISSIECFRMKWLIKVPSRIEGPLWGRMWVPQEAVRAL